MTSSISFIPVSRVESSSGKEGVSQYQLSSGRVLSFKDLTEKKAFEGLKGWDFRRLFYVQVRVHVAGEGNGRYVLISRKQVEKEFGVKTNFALFSKINAVAERVAAVLFKDRPVSLQLPTSDEFYQSIQAVPSKTSFDLRKRFSKKDAEKLRNYIDSNLLQWETEEVGWQQMEENREYKRIQRKKSQPDLPRTITVIREIKDEKRRIRSIIVHFNRSFNLNYEGKIGQGSYNRVKVGYNLMTKSWVAIRSGYAQKDKKSLDNGSALIELKHQRMAKQNDLNESIVGISAWGNHYKKNNEERIWSIQPLYSSDANQWTPLSFLEVARFAKRVTQGVKDIHRTHMQDDFMSHCDIKPGNIFLTKKGDPQIGDFGGAIHSKAIKKKGTKAYLYPYHCEDNRTNDLWALGLTIGKMAAKVSNEGLFAQISCYFERARKMSSGSLHQLAKWLVLFQEPDRDTLEHVVWRLLRESEEEMPQLDDLLGEIDRVIVSLESKAK